MTHPSPDPARTAATRTATRREGDGRAAAVDEAIDQIFDLYDKILDFQRQMVKAYAGWFSPFYSPVDEATRAMRDAMGRVD